MAIGMADIQFFPRSANSANHLLTKRDGLISRQTHQKKCFLRGAKSSHLSSSQESTTLSLYSLLGLSVFQVFFH
jgi:hypothetical protein